MLLADYGDAVVEYRRDDAPKMRVKSTWDMYRQSRPTYNEAIHKHPLRLTVYGLPDVWRIRPEETSFKPDVVDLDADRQHFLLKINLDVWMGRSLSRKEYFDWFEAGGSQVDTMVQWLIGATTHYRSHTNYWGLDNSANHLTGERLNLGNPKFAQLVTGWYVFRPNGKRRTFYKQEHIGFDCINASGDYWQYSPITHRWLFDQPMSTGRTFITDKGGTRIATDNLHKPYPQFNGRLVFPVWLPLDDKAYIPAEQVALWRGGYDKQWVEG